MEYWRNKAFKSLSARVRVHEGLSSSHREAQITEPSPPLPPSSNKSRVRLTFQRGRHQQPASRSPVQDKHKDGAGYGTLAPTQRAAEGGGAAAQL